MKNLFLFLALALGIASMSSCSENDSNLCPLTESTWLQVPVRTDSNIYHITCDNFTISLLENGSNTVMFVSEILNQDNGIYYYDTDGNNVANGTYKVLYQSDDSLSILDTDINTTSSDTINLIPFN